MQQPFNLGSLYINGNWVRTADTEAVLNPADETVIGQAPVGNNELVSDAIGAARCAFDEGPWPKLRPQERQVKLQAFLDAIRRRSADIVHLAVAEAGATRMLAEHLQYGIPMRHAQFYVDQCTRPAVTSLPIELTPNPYGSSTLGAGVMVREPVGVVAAITPYNFPFFLNISKVIPALAVGCTVVLKPSPYTPFSALILGQIADSVELPRGVLNVVTGGAQAGALLTTDPRVDLVTFTGSDAVGALIQAQAAPTLKRLLLELGGKSALIVRADADIAQAAAAGSSFCVHSGQGCALLTRHLVHNSIRRQYVERLKQIVAALKIGNPADPSVAFGPLIREFQRHRTEQYVASALSQGARLVTGGRRPPGFDKGFYYEPTIFDDVENEWRAAREEIFGPVGVVIGFDTDEEAVSLANSSDYGLSGGVFSADAGRAYELAVQIRTGSVSINGGNGTMSSHFPFGGVKRSGYGREYGQEGLNEFTYVKTISFAAR